LKRITEEIDDTFKFKTEAKRSKGSNTSTLKLGDESRQEEKSLKSILGSKIQSSEKS